MELKIAVAKVDKYGSGTSGDTVEIIERPNGGLSVVLGDGQIDAIDKKSISNLVTQRVIEQISNGIRDGAAVRLVSNAIFTEYQGHISASLNLVSVDLQTNTIIISRNNPVPVFLIDNENVECLSTESEPVGVRADIVPSIVELQMQPDMAIIVFSDGVFNAGQDSKQHMDICTSIEALIEDQALSAQEVAEFLLNQSIRLDNDRPKDDMSVVVIMITPYSGDRIRRINASLTLDDL